MSGRSRHRPRRGDADSNVLVEGDKGIFAGPLGGAEPGATESGDLASREYGVPQADIPGGVRHLVNPQTRHARPPGVPERPADYHKEHGVEPHDDGQYVIPPDATGEKPPRTAAEPRLHDAVPVYLQQAPGSKPRIRMLKTEGPVSIPTGTTDPVRIANRDEHRVKLWIANENATFANAIRIGSWEDCTDGRGLFMPGGGQPKDFATQDAVYAINLSGTAISISWGYETEEEVAEAGPA